MIKKNQHVVPVGTKWGVKGEGNSRYTKVTDIRQERSYGQSLYDCKRKKTSKNHGKDGRIRQKDGGNGSKPVQEGKYMKLVVFNVGSATLCLCEHANNSSSI